MQNAFTPEDFQRFPYRDDRPTRKLNKPIYPVIKKGLGLYIQNLKDSVKLFANLPGFSLP
ncbi:hypothetical protein D1B31_02210 [Neobacillus notoginsengisoli]|uniref:Uncharacterized protein n=1 Tax=Neobacillus notoginsengisoli TaxID=1578198 RepID=A0A417Z021_9BACI|nr:hypothetical protein D1B31_02210 [Neobacillus notoginsengisoli]